MNIHAERRKRRFAGNEGKILWRDDGHPWRVVLNVLSMFRLLQRSYFELGEHERAGIDERVLRFNGFDGNGEHEYLHAARVLVEREGLYPETPESWAGDGLDAHVPTLPCYRRMLKAYSRVSDMELLERDDIARILAAAQSEAQGEEVTAAGPRP